MIIDSFDGKYRFLSNFYPSEICVEEKTYKTVEHAYQASKTWLEGQEKWVREAKTPGEAKKRGRKVSCRYDWEDAKVEIMLSLLKKKFEIPELREKLIETGDVKLIEGNTWRDTFWGVCDGIGENHLGKLLMKVRDEQ